MKKDKLLFRLLEEKTNERWKRFSEFYENDSKPFINKISRDYKKTGKFPIHVLKMIKSINKDEYNSGVCILRGGLPYSVLFETYGWKIHYVLCGRKNEQNGTSRFNQNVDRTLKNIKGKKVLFIENNSPTGNTPTRVRKRLRKTLFIKKPDLFLDYFFYDVPIPSWLTKPFWKNKERLGRYGRIFVAKEIKVKESEREKLINEFINKLGDMN